MDKYGTYFENFFAGLRLSRPNFKASGTYTATALTTASLGAAGAPFITDLNAALTGFDENLTDRQDPTQGDTAAYRAARKAWLAFVDDTAKDYVTPKLRKAAHYADFKALSRNVLAELSQPELPLQSQALVDLYTTHAAALGYPTVVADAKAKLQAVLDTMTTRVESDTDTDATILDLQADWLRVARALRRAKAFLELQFDDPAKVYSFFDFSKVKLPKGKKVKPANPANPATPPS